MSLKISAFALAAASAAASAVLLSATPASAIKCPDGTRWTLITTVAGRQVGACLPYAQCDPAACPPPPTEAPPRD